MCVYIYICVCTYIYICMRCIYIRCACQRRIFAVRMRSPVFAAFCARTSCFLASLSLSFRDKNIFVKCIEEVRIKDVMDEDCASQQYTDRLNASIASLAFLLQSTMFRSSKSRLAAT